VEFIRLEWKKNNTPLLNNHNQSQIIYVYDDKKSLDYITQKNIAVPLVD